MIISNASTAQRIINNDLINDIENLVFYSDFVSKILIENGYHGKSEALAERYMKIKGLTKWLEI